MVLQSVQSSRVAVPVGFWKVRVHETKLANRLRELREARGLTQRQMADAVGMQQGDWSNYERAKSAPRRDRLAALDAFFGTGEELRRLKREDDFADDVSGAIPGPGIAVPETDYMWELIRVVEPLKEEDIRLRLRIIEVLNGMSPEAIKSLHRRLEFQAEKPSEKAKAEQDIS